MIPFIETPSFMVYTALDGTPRQVNNTHRNFNAILAMVKSVETYEQLLAAELPLEELLAPINVLKRIASIAGSELCIDDYYKITLKVDNKAVVIPSALSSYISTLYQEGGNLKPLICFLKKMSKNPDQDIAQQIWGFISVSGLCLTPDGNFLAYKNVREDFKSIHDGRTDNSPGTVVSMPRNNVEKNPNHTCATGLHFAAWGYLRHYSLGGKTVLVSTSPEDVVSIPTDYNNQKGRACKYQIIREVSQPEELKDKVIFIDGKDVDKTDGFFSKSDGDVRLDC
jgi:hypothetical protein